MSGLHKGAASISEIDALFKILVEQSPVKYRQEFRRMFAGITGRAVFFGLRCLVVCFFLRLRRN
jgi:hypothetical protein